MTATTDLIALVERLRPTGEIGDGMVAQLRDLARRAREEQAALAVYVDEAEALSQSEGVALPPLKQGGRVEIIAESPPRVMAVQIMDGGRCRNCGCPR